MNHLLKTPNCIVNLTNGRIENINRKKAKNIKYIDVPYKNIDDDTHQIESLITKMLQDRSQSLYLKTLLGQILNDKNDVTIYLSNPEYIHQDNILYLLLRNFKLLSTNTPLYFSDSKTTIKDSTIYQNSKIINPSSKVAIFPCKPNPHNYDNTIIELLKNKTQVLTYLIQASVLYHKSLQTKPSDNKETNINNETESSNKTHTKIFDGKEASRGRKGRNGIITTNENIKINVNNEEELLNKTQTNKKVLTIEEYLALEKESQEYKESQHNNKIENEKSESNIHEIQIEKMPYNLEKYMRQIIEEHEKQKNQNENKQNFNDFNDLNDFITNTYNITKNKDDIIEFKDLYNEYKKYSSNTYKKYKIEDLEKELIKIFKNLEVKVSQNFMFKYEYYGLKLKSNESESSNTPYILNCSNIPYLEELQTQLQLSELLKEQEIFYNQDIEKTKTELTCHLLQTKTNISNNQTIEQENINSEYSTESTCSEETEYSNENYTSGPPGASGLSGPVGLNNETPYTIATKPLYPPPKPGKETQGKLGNTGHLPNDISTSQNQELKAKIIEQKLLHLASDTKITYKKQFITTTLIPNKAIIFDVTNNYQLMYNYLTHSDKGLYDPNPKFITHFDKIYTQLTQNHDKNFNEHTPWQNIFDALYTYLIKTQELQECIPASSKKLNFYNNSHTPYELYKLTHENKKEETHIKEDRITKILQHTAEISTQNPKTFVLLKDLKAKCQIYKINNDYDLLQQILNKNIFPKIILFEQCFKEIVEQNTQNSTLIDDFCNEITWKMVFIQMIKIIYNNDKFHLIESEN